MNVVLVQPPSTFRDERGALPSGYSGVGILSLRAWLQRRGHRVRLLNLGNEQVPAAQKARLLRDAVQDSPAIVAISLNWVHLFRGAVQAAGIVRKTSPQTPIVLGGQHASLFADEIATACVGLVDHVIVGEAEIALAELVEGGATVSGTVQVIRGRPVPDVDDLPYYDYDDIEPFEEHALSALSTVRGPCPRRCLYCLESWGLHDIGRRRMRAHSVEWCVGQAARFVQSGRRILSIQDPFFVLGDGPAVALADGLARARLGLHELNLFIEPGEWSGAVFQALGRSGAERITLDLGVESGSSAVLRASGRMYDRDTVLRDIDQCIAEGILPYTWWMVGMPGETEEDFRQTRDLLIETMEHGAVPRWVTPLVLFPGTGAFRQARRFGIRPRMHGLLDMLPFSDVRFDPMGWYPALQTHDLEGLPGLRILSLAAELKREIRQRWGRLVLRCQADARVRRHAPFLGTMLGDPSGMQFEDSSFF